MRTNGKKPTARHYHHYTEDNFANAVAFVNNGVSKKLAALYSKYHPKLLSASTLEDIRNMWVVRQSLFMKKKGWFSRLSESCMIWSFFLTNRDFGIVIKNTLTGSALVLAIFTSDSPGVNMTNAFIEKKALLASFIRNNIFRNEL